MITVEALRPWATSPNTARGLRWAFGTAHPTHYGLVVLLPGAIAPETIGAGTWVNIEGHPVALVSLEVVRALAAGRSPSAAAALDGAPPANGGWCLALAADGSAVTWSTMLRHLPRVPAAMGDA